MSESEIASSFNPTIVTGTESREVGSLANFIGPSFNTGTLVKRNNVVAEPVVVTIARQSVAEVVTQESGNDPHETVDRR